MQKLRQVHQVEQMQKLLAVLGLRFGEAINVRHRRRQNKRCGVSVKAPPPSCSVVLLIRFALCQSILAEIVTHFVLLAFAALFIVSWVVSTLFGGGQVFRIGFTLGSRVLFKVFTHSLFTRRLLVVVWIVPASFRRVDVLCIGRTLR